MIALLLMNFIWAISGWLIYKRNCLRIVLSRVGFLSN